MGDLTDQQVWGAPVREATPGASYQPHYAQQLPDGTTVNTAVPLSDQQVWPGAGQVPQPAPALPESWIDRTVGGLKHWNDRFQLSFDQAFDRPYDNLAHWTNELPGVGGFLKQNVNVIDPDVARTRQQEVAAAGPDFKPDPVGSFAGGAMATAPLALLTRNPMIGGALAGAASTEHPDDPASIALDAGLGAAGGKAGDLATGAALHLLSPTLRPAVQTLVDNGVKLTPGQILGGGWKTTEDVIDHIPGVGQLIKSARANSVNTFDQAAMNRALSPIGAQLPAGMGAGRNAITYTGDQLSDKFNSIIPGLTVTPDDELAAALKSAGSGVSTKAQGDLADILAREFYSRAQPDGAIIGDQLGAADTNLGNLQRTYAKDPNADNQQLASALRDAHEAVRDAMGRQNPWAADDLSNAREGWANLTRIEGAGSSLGAKEGVFTPAQLANSVRSMGGGLRSRTYARGDALLQDLTDAGQAVLPSTVPDSGTAVRGLTEAALAGAGAHEVGALNPTTMGLAAALAAPYTTPGLAASRYLLAGSRPQYARDLAAALQQYTRPFIAGPAGAGAAMMGNQQVAGALP